MKSEKEIFYMYYIEADNLFVDEDAYIIYNPFTLITPQDLFLFHYDNVYYNMFPMVNNPDVICAIIPIPDEVLSCFRDIWGDMDVGDDYERIGRYERARESGCFLNH